MKISAEVVAASVSPAGYKLVTLKVVFPRIILPEFNTHRELSRSFTSNRAMPAGAAQELTCFTPLHWGLAQTGMQAKEEEHANPESMRRIWGCTRDKAIDNARWLDQYGLAKQTCNRLLEPFQFCVGVVSATSQVAGGWPMANFLGLRAKSAKVEPHMHELAWCMADAIHGARWVTRRANEWHLPFVETFDGMLFEIADEETAALASAMRCARVSYNKFGGEIASLEEDAAAARVKLMSPGDLHGSPFEHQACPWEALGWGPGRSGNFQGWQQFRKMFPNELTQFTDADYAVGRVRKLKGQE